jgi:hypothetical protein
MILIALMLALIFGGASQPKPVEAAQGPAEWVAFKLDVIPKDPPMFCTGKSYQFFVSIDKTIYKTLDEKDQGLPAPAIGDPNVKGTIVSGPGTLLGSLDEGDTQTTFVFKSNQRGDTTLKFSAAITAAMIGGKKTLGSSLKQEETVKLKIRPCKFKVTTIETWNIPGQASGYVAATSKDAEVKAPDPQSPFTGSTSVNWIATVGGVRDCTGVATVGSSKLDWNGTMNDSGQLTLNGNFQTAAVDFQVRCAGGGESLSDSMQFEMTPDPVTLTIASSGGTINQSQTLEWEGANPGQITITIVPVEDTGTAFIPGAHELSWDNLSSQFAALNPLP